MIPKGNCFLHRNIKIQLTTIRIVFVMHNAFTIMKFVELYNWLLINTREKFNTLCQIEFIHCPHFYIRINILFFTFLLLSNQIYIYKSTFSYFFSNKGQQRASIYFFYEKNHSILFFSFTLLIMLD